MISLSSFVFLRYVCMEIYEEDAENMEMLSKWATNDLTNVTFSILLMILLFVLLSM